MLGFAWQCIAFMKDYRTLEVWQLGRELAVRCYAVTARFPKEELYGLTSQIRRAATSIPSNIAEGVGRDSDRELLRFLRIAIGSLNELETQILISRDLQFSAEQDTQAIEDAARHLSIKLRNFATKLQNDIENSPKRYVREDLVEYGAEQS